MQKTYVFQYIPCSIGTTYNILHQYSFGCVLQGKIFLHNHIETKQSTDESEKRLKGIQYFRFRIVMLLVKNMLYPFLKPSYNIIERKNERLFQLANV